MAEDGEGAAKERNHFLPGHVDHHGAGVGRDPHEPPRPRLM